MTNWWQPTAENFLDRVSKEQITEALREADKVRPYDVADMKKAQLAAHANADHESDASDASESRAERHGKIERLEAKIEEIEKSV